MKKQTAFQYYIEQHNIIASSRDKISIAERFKLFDELLQKTKQMEKEQIMEAYHAAINLEYHLDMTSSKEYYEQTYGGNK